MEIWSKCDICGRDIPVGELCYGLKKGNCICKDCCTGFENCTFTLAPAPTLTPPNEPLSIEQLREMDGEPVWVKCLKPNKYINPPVRWRILEKSITGTFGVWDGEDSLIERNYGTDWLAYRRPPEGEV